MFPVSFWYSITGCPRENQISFIIITSIIAIMTTTVDKDSCKRYKKKAPNDIVKEKISVPNHSLDGPFTWLGLSHSLDNSWTRPIVLNSLLSEWLCLPDKRSIFGPANQIIAITPQVVLWKSRDLHIPPHTHATQKTELLNSHLSQIGCCNQRFWHSGKLLSGLGRAHRINACLIHSKNYRVNGVTSSKWFKPDKEEEEKVNPEDRRREGIHSKGRKGRYIRKGRGAGINNTVWVSIINFLEAQDH